jgi:hypothetical protein
MKKNIRWWRWMWSTLFIIVFAAPAASTSKGVKQVVIKQETRIEGRIQKPEVWYLLPPANLNYEGTKLEQKLVPKIEEAIKKAPF